MPIYKLEFELETAMTEGEVETFCEEQEENIATDNLLQSERFSFAGIREIPEFSETGSEPRRGGVMAPEGARV